MGHICIKEQIPPQVLAGLSLLPCSLCIFYNVCSSLFGPPHRTSLPSVGLSDLWGGGPFFWLNKDFLVNTLTWPVVFGEDFRGSSWDHLSARVTLMLPPNPGS